MRAWRAPLLLFVLCLLPLQAWSALDAAVIKLLGSDTTDDRINAIGQLAVSTDPLAAALLRGLGEGSVYALEDGRLLIVANDKAVDAATGEAVAPVPEIKDQLIVNNRLRKALERISHQKIIITRPEKPTPFSFPIMVDRLREKLTTEKLEDRIKRMALRYVD